VPLLLKAVPYLVITAIIYVLAWGVHGAGKQAGFSGGVAQGYEQGQKAGYNAGLLKGREDGYQHGVADTQKIHDQQLLTLMAESRAASAEAQREASQHVREVEASQRAAIEAAQVARKNERALAALGLSRLTERLRAAQTPGDPVHHSDGSSGVPQVPAAPAGVDGAAPGAGLLHRAVGEDLLSLAVDAEDLSAKYRLCLRYAKAAKEATQ